MNLETMARDKRRLNEAFLGYLADQATVDINTAWARYRDVVEKHDDDDSLAFPVFVDAVEQLPYVSYDNKTGDIHFLLETFLWSQTP